MAKSQTDLATENACFLELHINGIIQFVLFCVWNAHGLICSTISLAQGWCQLPPHIPNSVEKVREDCAWVSKAKILEIRGSSVMLHAWDTFCPRNLFHLAHGLCSVQTEASWCALCRLPANHGAQCQASAKTTDA